MSVQKLYLELQDLGVRSQCMRVTGCSEVARIQYFGRNQIRPFGFSANLRIRVKRWEDGSIPAALDDTVTNRLKVVFVGFAWRKWNHTLTE